MKILQAELLLDAQASLGEGPVWREEEQALYWVDIIAGKLHRTTGVLPGETVSDHVWKAASPIACYTFTRSGRILGAGYKGFGWLELGNDTLDFTPWIDPEADKPSIRFNDGKCDIRGRFLAGSMASGRDGVRIEGGFYVLEPSGEWRTLLHPVGISNGLAFTRDTKTLYYIDTPTNEIVAFDYDIETGSIANRRVVRHFDGMGGPDGMTIDNDGNLWAAFFGGAAVRCIRPADGEILAEVQVPAPNITSCCFGGPDYGTLFITCARMGMKPEALEEFPHAGGIFTVRPGVTGGPFPLFAD